MGAATKKPTSFANRSDTRPPVTVDIKRLHTASPPQHITRMTPCRVFLWLSITNPFRIIVTNMSLCSTCSD